MNPFVYLIFSLRFLVSVLIIRFPFAGVWLNYFLDIVDGDLFQVLDVPDSVYQPWDKTADLVSYVFMVIAGRNWRISKTLYILFFYRLVGQILFLITTKEAVLFYFQNFLEPLMLLYTLFIFKKGTEAEAYKLYKKHFKLIWFIIIAYKVWNEWYLHIANIDLSKLILGIDGTMF